jgi:hypothetical protein
MRPLRVGEILDVAIKIYWRNAATLFRLVAIVVAPVQIVTALILVSIVPDPQLLNPQPTIEPTPAQLNFDASDIWTAVAGVLVILLLAVVSATLATGACFKAVTDAYLGHVPEWRAALRYVVSRLGSILLVTILAVLAWLAPFVAAGIVAVPIGISAGDNGLALLLISIVVLGSMVAAAWLYVSFSVAVPALLTEEVRGRAALKRSFGLVRGRWWPVFGIIVLGTILAGIVTQIISGLLTGLTFTDLGDSVVASLIINAVATTVASVVTTPFSAAYVSVMYFDLRVRKEGFDLELLAAQMGMPPPAGGRPLPPQVYPPPSPPAPGTGGPPFWPPPPGWRPGPQDDRG